MQEKTLTPTRPIDWPSVVAGIIDGVILGAAICGVAWLFRFTPSTCVAAGMFVAAVILFPGGGKSSGKQPHTILGPGGRYRRFYR